MLTTRFRLSGAAVALALFGCGPELAPPSAEIVEGIPELSQPLTVLTTPCTYASDTKWATVVVESGETAILSKRSVDSALLVNGEACEDAKTTQMKRVFVSENPSAAGDETVILDFINGSFGKGTTSTVGISINFGTGSGDSLKIRGSSSVDRISVGTNGIATDNDNNVDIGHFGADELVFSLGDGADVFTGAGGHGSGTAYQSTLTVFGGAGNDTLTGGDGDDVISGGDGNDTIAGGPGADMLYGGEGNDTFDEGAAPNGADTFDGEGGLDVVSYASRTATVTVTMGSGADDGEAGENDDVSMVEGVTGGSGNDTLTGDAENNLIKGGPGNDTIDGGDGDDEIHGGEGNDTLTGGDGDDKVYGENGDDVLYEGNAENGADLLFCGAGTDLIDYSDRSENLTVTMLSGANDGEQGEGDNIYTDCENLNGGSGDDHLTGNNLANVIDGGDGDDVMNGGAGNDTFLQGSGDDGADTIYGGAGVDLVDYSLRTNNLHLTMTGTAADDGESGEMDDIQADVENVNCGDGNDYVVGNSLANKIDGGAGSDTIDGAGGNDEIYGGDDDDDLSGGDGDDLIDGGAGNDDIDCGAGDGDIGFNNGTGSIDACEL